MDWHDEATGIASGARSPTQLLDRMNGEQPETRGERVLAAVVGDPERAIKDDLVVLGERDASGRHRSTRSYRMRRARLAFPDVGRRAAASTWTAMAELTLISWNVNGNRRVDEQASAVLAEAPDAVAPQEVRHGTLDDWRAELESAGFAVVSTQHLVGERTNFVLTASRHPIVEVAPAKAFSVPFSERLLSTTLDVGGRRIELLNTHVPDGSGNGWRKVEHFEALYAYIARTHVPGVTTRILCGDFNSPRRALPDGRVITWGQSENGRLLVDRGERWDRAERSVIVGLAAYDLIDTFRALHPDATDVSWATRRGDRLIGRRFDHVFAARSLVPRSCEYRHAWREGRPRLSDHSAIVARFALP